VQPKRWIVERKFVWLGLSWRHSKGSEWNLEKREAFIEIRMIHLMLRQFEKAQMANEKTGSETGEITLNLPSGMVHAPGGRMTFTPPFRNAAVLSLRDSAPGDGEEVAS
jgi:hypothetical protein